MCNLQTLSYQTLTVLKMHEARFSKSWFAQFQMIFFFSEKCHKAFLWWSGKSPASLQRLCSFSTKWLFSMFDTRIPLPGTIFSLSRGFLLVFWCSENRERQEGMQICFQAAAYHTAVHAVLPWYYREWHLLACLNTELTRAGYCFVWQSLACFGWISKWWCIFTLGFFLFTNIWIFLPP